MRTFKTIRSLLFASTMLAVSIMAPAQIGISISFGPPALPVYEQPLCPGEGYLWTPGYWANDDDEYYWVPGTWVEPPQVGYLWTPGYWAWNGNGYLYNQGYWGEHVGFYGGIAYGYGYSGDGYEGGRWDHDRFFYNRSVNNVNVTEIHNVYNTTVINNNSNNRVSYNGGNGGIEAHPRQQDEVVARERHIAPEAAQMQHVQAARSNPELRASVNHGKPPIAATAKPGAFNDRAAVPAREAGAPYNPPANHASTRPAAQPAANASEARPGNNVPRPPTMGHARDLTPHSAPPPPDAGSSKAEQRNQQQQERLVTRQNQDHQKLQQRQTQEDQRMTQRQMPEPRQQQVEQRHAQQTQQMEQRHTQQSQRVQGNPHRDQGPPPNRN